MEYDDYIVREQIVKKLCDILSYSDSEIECTWTNYDAKHVISANIVFYFKAYNANKIAVCQRNLEIIREELRKSTIDKNGDDLVFLLYQDDLDNLLYLFETELDQLELYKEMQ